jgi:N-acetylglutamate synthase-like GNAT family acetyltransferase
MYTEFTHIYKKLITIKIMEIREYNKRDKEKVLEMVAPILKGIFNSRVEENSLYKEFESNRGYVLYLVAEIEQDSQSKIIGTVALKHKSKNTVELKRVYLDQEYRGKGVAQSLFDRCLGFAQGKGYKKIIFSTYPIMSNVQTFLRKNGFVENKEINDIEKIHFERVL